MVCNDRIMKTSDLLDNKHQGTPTQPALSCYNCPTPSKKNCNTAALDGPPGPPTSPPTVPQLVPQLQLWHYG